MTVWGWDASDYDWDRGPMDYGAAYRDGIRFCTHKATEGTKTQHRHTGEALARARAAGIPILGTYHVVRTPGNGGHGSIAAQVSWYLARLDAAAPWWRKHPYWIHQVDVEIWPYDRVTAAQGKAFAVELRNRRLPGWIVIYASQGQYGDQLKGSGIPLWNASYGSNPAKAYAAAYPGDKSSRWGSGYTLLQFGSKTRIGSQSTCDADAYRGSLDQLKALISPQEEDDMTPDEHGAVIFARDFWTKGGTSSGVVVPGTKSNAGIAKLDYLMQTVTAMAKQSGMTPEQLDEIAQAAREGAASAVTPEAIAAAIPDDLAQEVVDLLAARLAASAA